MSVFTVLERLAPRVEREVNLILNSRQEAETLRYKLERIQEGLQDAERQGVTDLNVRSWLERLQDVMYQIDDALDKWETKNLEPEIEQSEYDNLTHPWEKVRSLFLSVCLCFNHVVGRRELTLEMQALSARLDNILEERGKYSFVSRKNDSSREFERPETTSSVDESNVCGRKSDKDGLVQFLLSKDEEQCIQVISIVGVGGLGKTTLAQLVYNDPRLKEHFDLKAWVSVPDPFDAKQVAKAILEAFGESSSGISTLEKLGDVIKAHVLERNFLLVLDGVWTVYHTQWESLKNFLVGASKCRILVTTRDEIAARTLGTSHWPRLNLLSDLDCATILNARALGERIIEHSEFHDIGFEIAKKCNGLPLAAKAIGHMLASRLTTQEWRGVLGSPLWRYEDDLRDIFRPLRLSYMDLSPILKRCFLSCVLFLKGSQFHVGALIRIWMAQGYINLSKSWDEVDLKGQEYFQKLFMLSFFQEVRRDEKSGLICKMHDLMLEFAGHLSRSEYYFILDHTTHNMSIDPRTRNFSAISVPQGYLHRNFLRQLKRVRVLCLRDCGLRELSEKVGELIHLRYLDLSWNPITKLPETLTDLFNLQTLDLRFCSKLSRLPDGIKKLVNLRYLLNYRTDSLRQYPKGLEMLACLWTLEEFRATGESVGYLRNLNELTGFLIITVDGLNKAVEGEKANLINKKRVDKLQLTFSNDVTMDVIEAMVPPPQLQFLNVEGERTHRLPSWITTGTRTMCFNNLKHLILSGFRGDSFYYFPTLGKLQMLEKLHIDLIKFNRVRHEFLGGFPKLKKLAFSRCIWWEEWEDLEEVALDCVRGVKMPCLEKLKISGCPRLQALPHILLLHVAASLHKLNIENSESLEARYGKERGADWDKISHIPSIYIPGG